MAGESTFLKIVNRILRSSHSPSNSHKIYEAFPRTLMHFRKHVSRQYAISISAHKVDISTKLGNTVLRNTLAIARIYKSLAVLSSKSIKFIKSEHAYLSYAYLSILTVGRFVAPCNYVYTHCSPSFVVYCRSINDRRSLSYQTVNGNSVSGLCG